MDSVLLTEVEAFAKLFFSPEKIMIILDLKKEDTIRDDFKKAYEKGRLIQEGLIRKSILELAINGSSPAQVLAMKFIDDSKLDGISV